MLSGYCSSTFGSSFLVFFFLDVETPVTFSQSIHAKQWHDGEIGLAADGLILVHLDKHRDKRDVSGSQRGLRNSSTQKHW
jgi:hypothetical protein